YSGDIKGELLTPTGAAIITSVCDHYGPIPQTVIEQTGYGAGSREYKDFPNVLRVLVGETDPQNPQDKRLWMIETNIDDVSPQIVGHVMERAFELGALDCFFTPVQMKKNRPGVLLSILSDAQTRESVMNLLFTETTTLGVRSYEVLRRALQRSVIPVETQYGQIDVKVALLNGRVVNEMPEFEQCRAAALAANVPLKTVEEAVKFALATKRS
ncbi:MAG TPA: LarC family nickel insertion protein, partial [Pyrinomonadaceae bacterium]|nr:LarC family nickel insertion protein [Pyrinomonadaceae bacterium]